MRNWSVLLLVRCFNSLRLDSGQATTHLRPFSEVLGIDPSQGMLDKARVYLAGSWEDKSDAPEYKLLVGSAEDLSRHLPDESVDLLIAGPWPNMQRMEFLNLSKT